MNKSIFKFLAALFILLVVLVSSGWVKDLSEVKSSPTVNISISRNPDASLNYAGTDHYSAGLCTSGFMKMSNANCY